MESGESVILKSKDGNEKILHHRAYPLMLKAHITVGDSAL